MQGKVRVVHTNILYFVYCKRTSHTQNGHHIEQIAILGRRRMRDISPVADYYENNLEES